jgi:hypothetical protein
MRVGEKTKPIGAAHGRDWGLGMADWGFEDARCVRLVWSSRQTKPIVAEEASALMMDNRLLMIWDLRAERLARRVDVAPNKANHPIYRGSNPAGHGNWGFEDARYA